MRQNRMANPASAGLPPMPVICMVAKRRNHRPRSASLVRSASARGAARQNAPQPKPTRNPGTTSNALTRSTSAKLTTPAPTQSAASAAMRAAPTCWATHPVSDTPTNVPSAAPASATPVLMSVPPMALTCMENRKVAP
jgi:hypothetical protein